MVVFRSATEFSILAQARNRSSSSNVLSFFVVVRVNHPLPDFTEATRDAGM